MDPIARQLLELGATGVLAAALVALYRSKETREREHRGELERVRKEHSEQMAQLAAHIEAMRDRFEVKADRQLAHASAALERVGAALEAAARKRRAP